MGWEIRNQNIKGNILYKVLLMVSEYETSQEKTNNAENATSNYLIILLETFYS